MGNIALIIDNSKIYLENKVKDFIKEWNLENEECNRITSWEYGIGSLQGLFGNPYTLLDLTNKTDFDNFVKLIKDKKKAYFFDGDWFSNNLIIITTFQQGSKSIVDLVNKNKGQIIKKQNLNDLKNELKINFKNKDVLNFVNEYIGEDYDILISLKNSLNSLTQEDIENISLTEIITYLPYEKGNIPIWNFLENIFNKDIDKTLDDIDRTLEHNHYLVLLTIMKNKFRLFYQYTIANLEKLKESEIVKKLEVNNAYSFISFKRCKGISHETIEYILKLIDKAEKELKGDNIIDGKEYIKVISTKIILALKNNKPLERL